jgi:hypothetical protein
VIATLNNSKPILFWNCDWRSEHVGSLMELKLITWIISSRHSLGNTSEIFWIISGSDGFVCCLCRSGASRIAKRGGNRTCRPRPGKSGNNLRLGLPSIRALLVWLLDVEVVRVQLICEWLNSCPQLWARLCRRAQVLQCLGDHWMGKTWTLDRSVSDGWRNATKLLLSRRVDLAGKSTGSLSQ